MTTPPVSEPTGKIGPQPWITAADTRAVIGALTAKGTEVRFVGGCVRDALIKRPVRDIDIATPDAPESVMALLQAAAIKALPTGIEHGTVTAVVDGRPFEITTLRIDVETDGRRARVAYTDDWIADAARRDFTINTFSATPSGDVYDPFRALDDLAHGRVFFVGVARQRVEEDLLRILRFFRIYADYGRPPADADALAACRALAHRLPELSGERIRMEMFRILLAPNPADTIHLMQGERILEHILPEAGGVGRLRMLSWLETTAIKVASVVPDAVRRLAALLETDRDGAAGVAERFRLSNAEKDRLTRALDSPGDFGLETSAKTRRRLFHRHGADAVRDWVLLAWAGERAIAPRQTPERCDGRRDFLAAADAWRAVDLPIGGRDALALGMKEGPALGGLIKSVEGWWEEEDFRPGRDECLEKLKELIG